MSDRPRLATYGFALLVAGFLAVFSFEWELRAGYGDRVEFTIAPKDPPPLGLLVPGLTLVGLTLGINIDPKAIAAILRRN